MVDNCYTSVELAHAVLAKNTYILGTLRSSRKNNPKDVIQKKLIRGDVMASESNTSLFIEKWRNKRNILVQTTKYVPEMLNVKKMSEDVIKPK